MLLRRRCCLTATAALLFLLGGCGYVGDPLPPLANIPKPVTALNAVQRGDRLIVQFQLPTHTTEDVLIKAPLTVDLRAGVDRVVPFSPDAWANAAKPFSSGTVSDRGLARYEIPVAGFVGHEATIGARVTNSYGKNSDWSGFLSVPVVAPPEIPATVQAEPTAEGVRVHWSGPPGLFRVLRHGPGQTVFSLAAKVDRNEWTDPSTEVGKPYTYLVQRVIDLGGSREAESELSAELSITPQDTFPPPAPTGLRASGASRSVELSWDRSPDATFAGYRIYRAAPGADFTRIGDVATTPAYSDRTAEPAVVYRYTVTAVDQAGNESARSAVVEAQRQ